MLYKAQVFRIAFPWVAGIVYLLLSPAAAAETKKAPSPEKQNIQPVNIHDYANTHPIVLQTSGTVTRNTDETWELSLEGVTQGLSFKPVRGRTEIEPGTTYSGAVSVGAHGAFLALIVETDDGDSLKSVVELAEDGLHAIIGPESSLQSAMTVDMSPGEVAAAMGTKVRLVTAFHLPGDMRPFGQFGSSSTATAPTIGTIATRECPGGSCSCFLACSACCGPGQAPNCDCQFLGQNNCGCEGESN